MGLDYAVLFFFFWGVNKTFCSWDRCIFKFTSPSTIIKTQNRSSPSKYNSPLLQLMLWNFKRISVSMMHAFGYFCILYRKRFSIYSNCTFLHNFKGLGLCSAKRILPKVWLLISFICICFPSFLWISKLKHPKKTKD